MKDRTAVVTGASRGIGLAIAAGLAPEGARVVADARTDTVELARLREEYDVRFVHQHQFHQREARRRNCCALQRATAALTNLSKALAEDLTPQGIRVNAVSPGPVRTSMWTAPGGFARLFADRAGTTVDDVMDRLLPESMAISSGRITEPEEVAALVVFLASERSANITGSDYVIDGGMYKSAA